jgi:hypothetical protein
MIIGDREHRRLGAEPVLDLLAGHLPGRMRLEGAHRTPNRLILEAVRYAAVGGPNQVVSA